MAILEAGEPPMGGQNAPKTDLAASLPSGATISSLEWNQYFQILQIFSQETRSH